MTNKSCVLGIVLLVLTLHACSARPLGFGGNKQTQNTQDLMRISSTHETLLTKVYDNSNYEQHNSNQLLVMAGRNLKAHVVLEDFNNKELDEVLAKTTFQAFQNRAADEKWKEKARRSSLQSLSHDYNNDKPQETINSEEEAVVLDYAQPHRKPPIHNKEP